MMRLERFINKLQGKSQGGPIALHRYKVIYFPVPKVACSSLIKFCANLLGIKEGPNTNIHEIYFPSIKLENISKYEDYCKFGFVRNPWDRLVSCYSNKIKNDADLTNKHYVNGVSRGFSKYGSFKAGMPFEDFVAIIKDWPDETSDPHFRSQYTFLADKDGELITNFVGQFESLSSDFANICKSSGMPDENLPHLKKSTHDSYRNYYTNELIDIVGQRYSKDIELFDYSF